MTQSDRERLASALIEEYGIMHLIAAACYMMNKESGGGDKTYTSEETQEFFESLDYDGLLELQSIADDIEIEEKYRKQ